MRAYSLRNHIFPVLYLLLLPFISPVQSQQTSQSQSPLPLQAKPITPVKPIIKVNKPLITLVTPENQKAIQITGDVGAISSTTDFSLKLININTKAVGKIAILKGGQFSGTVAGKPGEQIRITARNPQKKSSYGTFTIPAVHVAPKVIVTGDFPPLPTAPNVKDHLSAKKASLPIAIYINIVDERTGELLATEKINAAIYKPEDKANYYYRKFIELYRRKLSESAKADFIALQPKVDNHIKQDNAIH